MSTISIQGLQQAPLPLLSTDVIIVSRGTNQDYKSTMLSVWTIASSAFPSVTSILSTDQMMIWRSGSPYMANYSSIGFVSGTTTWFYSASPPSGWQIVATAGDAMLGVVDSSNQGSFVSGGTVLLNNSTGIGSWKMLPTQIPSHSHQIYTDENGTGGLGSFSYDSFSNRGALQKTQLSDGSQSGTWRPVTAVGIIATKL